MILPAGNIERLAADPEVRQALSQIPRDVSPARPPKAKSLFPAATEAELLMGLRSSDPEISLRGLIARVTLLEAQVAKLMKALAEKRRKP